MNITNDRLAHLLSEGRGVFLAGEGPLFLANDGSLYDNSGAMVLPPDAGRAAIVENFGGINTYVLPVAGAVLGGVKNGGNIAVNAEGEMTYTLPAAGSALGGVKNGGIVTVAEDGSMGVPGIVALTAVTSAAPENPADGDKYGNTTDKKIYVAASGSWSEASGADAAAAGILYAAGGLFYHWSSDDGFAPV